MVLVVLVMATRECLSICMACERKPNVHVERTSPSVDNNNDNHVHAYASQLCYDVSSEASFKALGAWCDLIARTEKKPKELLGDKFVLVRD